MGFNKINRNNGSAEIGYWLSEDYQGKGIMTECVRTLADFGFESLKLSKIEIRCRAENARSVNIPKRLGFKRVEKTASGEEKWRAERTDTARPHTKNVSL